MKYLILIAIIFAAVSCSAQKANFHALNKSRYTQYILWGSAPAVSSPTPFASSAVACTASATGFSAWGNGSPFTGSNGLPTIGQYVGSGISTAGWYVHAYFDPPTYSNPRKVPVIVVHVDATLHIDQIVTC